MKVKKHAASTIPRGSGGKRGKTPTVIGEVKSNHPHAGVSGYTVPRHSKAQKSKKMY